VSGADQLRSSGHWAGAADEPTRRAGLDFGRLVCVAVRWGDLPIRAYVWRGLTGCNDRAETAGNR